MLEVSNELAARLDAEIARRSGRVPDSVKSGSRGMTV
jgi:hypothetical protein